MKRLLPPILLLALAAPTFARPGGEAAPEGRDPEKIVQERAERQRRYEEIREKRAALQKELEASLPTAGEALPGWTDAATGRIASPAEAARTASPAAAPAAPVAVDGPRAGPRELAMRDRLLIGLVAIFVFLVALRAFLLRVGARRRPASAPAPSTMTVSLRPVEERRLR